jgi:thiol:disulfide interchange protein
MPCVLPILSIKLFGLLKQGGQSREVIVRNSLASAAGILFSFSGLALAAIAARRAGQAIGWGIQFQNPYFIAFLAIVLVLFTLNLWGLFEITLPTALSNIGVSNAGAEGMGSYFLSGFFATLLATPCSAPFLGTAMGFALLQPGSVILSIFIAVGMGMASPYFALALFPGTLRWLPKPGAWMLRIKMALGFFLAATVTWLGYVLSSQVDSVGVTYFCLCLVGLSFLVWLRGVFYEKNQAPSLGTRLILLVMLGVMVLAFDIVASHPQQGIVQDSVVTGDLHWIAFDEAAIPGYLKEGRDVFVDVTAQWCFTCKVNEKAVLQSAEIKSLLKKKNVVTMRADWTTHSVVIGDYLKKFGRAGIPFYVYYHAGQEPVVLSEFLTKKSVAKVLTQN